MYLTNAESDIPQAGQAGAVEITPEMAECGTLELLSYDPEFEPPASVVARVLCAVFGREVVPFHEVGKVGADLTGYVSDLSKAINRHWFVKKP